MAAKAYRILENRDLRKLAVMSRCEGFVYELTSSDTVVNLSYIWVVCWLSCSVSAVGVDEDGIVLDDFAVGTSEWLPY